MEKIIPISRLYRKRTLLWQVLLPLLTMMLVTIWSAPLDRFVSSLFYKQGQFASHPLLNFGYHYGFFPAWGLAGLALLVLVFSYWLPILRKWRQAALFLLLTLAIGPGLIVHALLKDHWGRPRPRQVIEYGGLQPFRAYYEPNFSTQPEPSKSFPSGHCSMGFYFFALAFIGKHYQRKGIYYLGMALALGLGGFLSFIRIAQGGHFLSDTLMSALIMWFTTLGLYFTLFKPFKA